MNGPATWSRRPASIDYALNLRAASDRLSEREIAIGRHWYPAAAARLAEIAANYLVAPDRLIYAAACVSAGLSWDATVETLFVLLDAHDAGEETFPRKGVHATFGFRGHERAWRILTTNVDPAEVCRGPKVEAFAANLAGDLDAVTIDRHICRAAGLVGRPKGPAALSIPQATKAQAAQIRAALRIEAARRSLRPAELQAAFWAASARAQETAA